MTLIAVQDINPTTTPPDPIGNKGSGGKATFNAQAVVNNTVTHPKSRPNTGAYRVQVDSDPRGGCPGRNFLADADLCNADSGGNCLGDGTVQAGVWVQNEHRWGVLYIGYLVAQSRTHGTGNCRTSGVNYPHMTYTVDGSSGYDCHGQTWQWGQGTGPHGADSAFHIWIYNPATLQSVKPNGRLNPWDPNETTLTRLSDISGWPGPGVDSPDQEFAAHPSYAMGAIWFDASTNVLWFTIGEETPSPFYPRLYAIQVAP
jgi:hypothetical protein